ncbi:MAG: shikimate kinase [Bacteroidales bacterium]|nr:shikimate kinase [Bacteroidales bacterium]
MKIFIIGYMGAGKSTAGKRLSNRLGIPFIDIDEAFEEKFRYSIPRFFDQFGEERFREFEHQCLKEIIHENADAVVSTGGGTPCFFNNLELMQKSGVTIYLKMHPKSLAERLSRSRRLRPVIRDIQQHEMPAFVETQLAGREAYYEQADIIIKGESLDMDELVRLAKDF